MFVSTQTLHLLKDKALIKLISRCDAMQRTATKRHSSCKRNQQNTIHMASIHNSRQVFLAFHYMKQR